MLPATNSHTCDVRMLYRRILMYHLISRCRCFSPGPPRVGRSMGCWGCVSRCCQDDGRKLNKRRTAGTSAAQHQRVFETYSYRILGRNRYPSGKHAIHFFAASVNDTLHEPVAAHSYHYINKHAPSHKSPWSDPQHPVVHTTDGRPHTTTTTDCPRRCKAGQQCAC
jgi:hypothetical protein